MISKVVFKTSNGEIEIKTSAESGDNHLIYIIGNYQLLPNSDGEELVTGPAGDWVVTGGGISAPNLADWWISEKVM